MSECLHPFTYELEHRIANHDFATHVQIIYSYLIHIQKHECLFIQHLHCKHIYINKLAISLNGD